MAEARFGGVGEVLGVVGWGKESFRVRAQRYVVLPCCVVLLRRPIWSTLGPFGLG